MRSRCRSIVRGAVRGDGGGVESGFTDGVEDGVMGTRRAEGWLPGNATGNTLFSERRARPAGVRASERWKELEMTAEALTEAIDACVKEYKIVAFIKGTLQEPDRFSHRMINVLNEPGGLRDGERAGRLLQSKLAS